MNPRKREITEIWIDCYELVKFLALNRSETVKDQETKEYDRVYEMREFWYMKIAPLSRSYFPKGMVGIF